MILGYSLTPFGHHPDAWQDARDSRHLGFEGLLAQVLAAESAGFAFVLLTDRMGLRPVDDLSSVAVPFEPTLLTSALATKAARIGFIAAAATTQHEPYNLARRFASLDLIGIGRSGWLALTSNDDLDRESEYLNVVTALWDSFEDNAFLYDKAAGRFFDPAKMHVAHHKGPHFSVRGPLNVNRSPQGRPVIAQMLGEGDNGLALGSGELLLVQAPTADGLIGIAQEAAKALKATGRASDQVRLVANIVPVVGASLQAAEEASEALRFSTQHSTAQPLRALRIVGTARMIADQLQELAEAAHLDGFTILPPTLDMATGFLADVVPELGRRGLIGGKTGHTLREQLGLPRPLNPAGPTHELAP